MDLHFRWVVLLFMLVDNSLTDDIKTQHMDDFIKVVETIELENYLLDPLAVVKGLRKAAGVDTPFIQHYLGYLSDDTEPHHLVIKPVDTGYITKVIKHRVTVLGVEEGVVLTADGTTVALSPLLLGIEAGLQSTPLGHVRGLYPLTLTKNLGLSFFHHAQSKLPASSSLGPGGCWDNVTAPQVFTLSGVASFATEALITGGMDGVIVGKHVAERTSRPLRLSGLLKEYYNHQLGIGGLDAAPALISQRRRTRFRKLANLPLLKRQIRRLLATYRRLDKDWKKEVKQKVERAKIEEIVNEGLKEFVHSYMDCPAIIPRCMWEAKPYRGIPTLLSLPLSFLFIHHTYEPSQPCLTFYQCSRDMRAMQRFHQDDRGWDDIGYSFVAGSDGYLYEGRGWHWQGAHTKGYNSKGYGVSFIGDYTSSIPSQSTMDLVRHQLAKCATDGVKLVSDFTIHGHRQLVSTSCPGDALYNKIKGWTQFGVRDEVTGVKL
ncbi:peptidoglycan recognition protein 6 [Electrophorus electricus]|uniref:peptidoglycan recognition protein 6 n=1 Tax=Electrophorus electricus TaxID=8005 RepID=UPI0015D0AC27|nr:peptidoglycan recognition protein 6 [Electrophorus electricus]